MFLWKEAKRRRKMELHRYSLGRLLGQSAAPIQRRVAGGESNEAHNSGLKNDPLIRLRVHLFRNHQT